MKLSIKIEGERGYVTKKFRQFIKLKVHKRKVKNFLVTDIIGLDFEECSIACFKVMLTKVESF